MATNVCTAAAAAVVALSVLVSSVVAGPTQLAIDPSAIPTTEGLRVQLGPVKKDSASPFFGEDRPWDVAWWNTYPTIAYDKTDSKYKLWYNGCGGCACKHTKTCSVVSPFAPTTATNLSNNGMCPHLGYNYSSMQFDGSNVALTYYAESSDGVAWDKPDLGLVEFQGSNKNNIVLNTNCDPNRGVFLDAHETNASRKFKMFGSFGTEGTQKTGTRRGGVATLVSADGKIWEGLTPVTEMDVAADTANNALYDPDLKKYIAFSRNHCTNNACNESGWGERRETHSTADNWEGPWTKATEALHGEHGYEMYSLVPYRAPTWTPGLYLAIGSFFENTNPEGYVKCELCRSTDYGKTWTRLAPHKEIIPLGAAGAFDSHTCYAAPPMLDPMDPKTTLLYYAGGDGPHSGGGKEHGRANFIARGSAPTDALAGLTPTAPDGIGGGSLRTAPIKISGAELRLRIAAHQVEAEALTAGTAASIAVHVEDLEGRRLFSGIATSTQNSAASSAGASVSEEVSVQWVAGEQMLLAVQGQTVVLAMELSAGATLFSFTFE